MRKFGLELEFTGDMGRAIDSLRAAGLETIDGRHSHLGYSETGWTIKRDGSVTNGGEMVGPPLDFDDPEQRAQVNTAVKALADSGASTHQSCGIHVHIEATNTDGSPFTGKQLAAVVRFVYKFEDAIYRVASSGWQTLRNGAYTYAKPIPDEIAQSMMKARTVGQIRDIWDGNIRQSRYGYRAPSLDRYIALNMRSYFQRNTVEFRHFNTSLNPTRVQTYVALCQAIMEDARRGHSRQTATNYPLGSMAAGVVTQEALMLRLQQVLTQNDKDTDRLMSVEDWKNFRKLLWKGSRPQRDIWGRDATSRFSERGGRRSA